MFLEKGFVGASMDEVAKRAGVSKQTVYSHFSSKEKLFGAAIRDAIERTNPEEAVKRVETHSLEADLTAVCEQYARLMLSEDAIAMSNLIVAASVKDHTIGDIFWKSGPEEFHARLQVFLQKWVDSGDLDIEDIELSAVQIIALLRGKHHFMRSIGIIGPISEDDILKNVTDTVKVFLKLYRA